jgi:isoquinoline 1-oxidoreductase beta subunit
MDRVMAASTWLKPDQTSVEGAVDLPYALPNLTVDYVKRNTPVPVGFWRSVGHSHTAFVTECFLDEVAQAAGQDPVALRRALLKDAPRHRAVLDLAAAKAGWGNPLPPRHGRGIALHVSYGSIVAEVAEVEVTADGTLRVHRVVCVIDCGTVVNPDTVAAQMQGGIVFGLTAALYGEVTLSKGAINESNFDSYEMLHMAEMPRIEVHIMPSQHSPGGVGEPGTPPIAPAVANAVFAVTGKRVRSQPLKNLTLA